LNLRINRFKKNRNIPSPLLIWPLVVLLVAPCIAQKPSPSPDFGQSALVSNIGRASDAWSAWETSDAGLEQRVFSLPMVDGRDQVQRALSEFLAYLDRRRQYGDSVSAYIDSSRVKPQDKNMVTLDAVNRDQLEVLGVSLARLQAKLEALQTESGWAQIRRSVQQERSDVLALQSSRRDKITVDRPLGRSLPDASSITSLAYRDSERQLRDALQKLWIRYYQSLVDAVEQRPDGSVPLIVKLPTNAAAGLTALPAVPSSPATNDNPLVGTWIYREGSLQFNDVAEPHQVILELWLEQGLLRGRYRADLQAFDGTTKHVDLKLRGRFVPGHDQTLEFQSADPDTSGKVVVEGPDVTGLHVMLVRLVESGGTIPRGREILTRR
jgi:hypothetical protein